jgi:hypothetical protein
MRVSAFLFVCFASLQDLTVESKLRGLVAKNGTSNVFSRDEDELKHVRLVSRETRKLQLVGYGGDASQGLSGLQECEGECSKNSQVSEVICKPVLVNVFEFGTVGCMLTLQFLLYFQCAGDLVCTQRKAYDPVPGCDGGEQFGQGVDFCVLATILNENAVGVPAPRQYTGSGLGLCDGESCSSKFCRCVYSFLFLTTIFVDSTQLINRRLRFGQ